jgi:hypothetical protein
MRDDKPASVCGPLAAEVVKLPTRG